MQGAQEVKQKLKEINDQFAKGEITTAEYGKQLREVRREATTFNSALKIQEQLWRAQHPTLQLVQRSLGQIGQVARSVQSAVNTISLIQIAATGKSDALAQATDRLRSASRDLESVKKKLALDPDDPKLIREYNDALDKFAEAQTSIGRAQKDIDNTKLNATIGAIATAADIAVTIGVAGANISAMSKALKDMGDVSVLVGAAFSSMWAQVLMPVAVMLTLDYFISKAMNIPALSEIGVKTGMDIFSTGKPSQEAQNLFDARTLGIQGAGYKYIQKPVETLFGLPPGFLTGENPEGNNLLPENVGKAFGVPSGGFDSGLGLDKYVKDFFGWLFDEAKKALTPKLNAGLAFGETMPNGVITSGEIPTNVMGKGGEPTKFGDITFGSSPPTKFGPPPKYSASEVPMNYIGQGGVTSKYRDMTFGSSSPNTILGAKAEEAYAEVQRFQSVEVGLLQQVNQLNSQLENLEIKLYDAARAIPPNTNIGVERAQAIQAQIQELERQRDQLNIQIQSNRTGLSAAELKTSQAAGVTATEYARLKGVAANLGIPFEQYISSAAPALGTRLGYNVQGRGAVGGGDAATIQALLSVGANVPMRLNDKGFMEYYLPSGSEYISGGRQGGGFGVTGEPGIDAYEKLFGKDIAVLGGFDLATPSGGFGGYVSAEAYRQQQAIANGGSIYAINKGLDYYGNVKYDPSTLNINPAEISERNTRDKFIASLYGLARGGVINEPSIATGLFSGNTFKLAEYGAETISPVGRGYGKGGWNIIINIDTVVGTDRRAAKLLADMVSDEVISSVGSMSI